MRPSALADLEPKNGRSRPPIVRYFASVAEIIEQAEALQAKHGLSLYADNWALGNDWTTLEATRAGLLAGEAPASVLRAYETIRSRQGSDPLTANGTGPTRRRRRVWHEEGDEVDPARMLAGSPTPWTRTIIGCTAPTVRLAVNIALSGSNTPEKFAETIAHAVSIADAITLAGYSVEIVGVCATVNNMNAGSATVYLWPMKRSDEPLDQPRLLSAGAPGLLRAYLLPFCHLDNASTTGGKCYLPKELPALIGTPHIIARHWEEGKEIDAQEQARRIIEASATA